MANPKAKVRWGGEWVTAEMAEMYEAEEKIMGWDRRSLTVVQGCWSGDVAASGSTHAGTGSSDLTPFEEKLKVQILCDLGDCRWVRPRIPGTWGRHNHGVKNYDSTAHRSARAQCASFMRGRNGLRGDGKNYGYVPPVFPYFKPGAYKGKWTVKVKECGGYAKASAASGIGKPKMYHKGDVITNIATVTVKGKDWVVCTDGKKHYWFVYKDNLQSGVVKYTPSTGTTSPAPVDPPPAPPPAPPATPTTPEDPSPVDIPTTVPPPKPEEEKPPPKMVTRKFNMALHNVCYKQSWLPGWAASWATRSKRIAARAKKNKVQVLLTQEQGTTAAARGIANEMGTNFDSILHGDDGLITMGNIFDKKAQPMKREGKFETGPGPTHDWSTWTEHTIPGSDYKIAYVNTHLWYADGSDAKNPDADDIRRRRSFDAILDKVETLFDDKTIVFIAGDLNCAFQDPYDPANAAAYAHSKSAFRDLELYAKSGVNVQYNSGQKTAVFGDLRPRKGSRQIDRVMVDKKWITSGVVTVNSRKVDIEGLLTTKGYFSKTKFETDHLSVVFGLTVKVPAK